jgi:hypothetical protein
MTFARTGKVAAAVGLSLFMVPHLASADTIVANCTSMVDFDIYTIDTEEPTQEIALIGTAEVAIDEKNIVLTGDFGEYKFDLEVGTLYHNDSDTSIYCTYKRSES